MTNLTAVAAQATVSGTDGRLHTYRSYGRNAYEARKALYAAARTFRMKVNKGSFTYRYDDVEEQIKHRVVDGGPYPYPYVRADGVTVDEFGQVVLGSGDAS